MYPFLLEIGQITIYSLWVFTTIGFFAALLITTKLTTKNRLSLKFIADNSLTIFLSGLILARLTYVIYNFKIFFQEISLNSFIHIFYIWDKGLSPWGGILGIYISLIILSKKQKQETLKWLDIITTSILGAMIFANIGTFLDGSNYGKATTMPWGVIIKNSIYTVPIHPTQIYATIYTLIITIILYNLTSKRKSKYPGQITLIGIFLYSTSKFIEEFFRGDESNIILGLRETQIYVLITLTISLTILLNKQYNFLTNIKWKHSTKSSSTSSIQHQDKHSDTTSS